MWSCNNGDGKIQTFEREINSPNKGLRHSITNYFPDIVNGEVKGFVVHIADITTLKLAEKELLHSKELLFIQNKIKKRITIWSSHFFCTSSGSLSNLNEMIGKLAEPYSIYYLMI